MRAIRASEKFKALPVHVVTADVELVKRHEEVGFTSILLKPITVDAIRPVVCGGESGPKARPCDFEWIKDVRRQCVEYGVEFYFKQTGAVFIKDGKTYHIERKFQESQARKAKMNYYPGE